jgi:hypothetical protein
LGVVGVALETGGVFTGRGGTRNAPARTPTQPLPAAMFRRIP